MSEFKREKIDYHLEYSLHDAIITKMKYKKGDLIFKFDEDRGYTQITRDHYVKGHMVMTRVDLDCSEILVYKRKGDSIKGKSYSLKKFIKKYKGERFQIIEEMHDYYTTKLKGFIHDTNKEFLMDLFYLGDMIYVLDDESEPEDTLTEDELSADDLDALDELEELEKEIDAVKDSYIPLRERMLISNTSREQRMKIVEELLGGQDDQSSLYDAYIEGIREIEEIRQDPKESEPAD